MSHLIRTRRTWTVPATASRSNTLPATSPATKTRHTTATLCRIAARSRAILNKISATNDADALRELYRRLKVLNQSAENVRALDRSTRVLSK